MELSIHDLLAEVDRGYRSALLLLQTFNSRPPRGGRPVPIKHCSAIMTLSIHDLLAEVDQVHANAAANFNLSIHDLLAEVDGN